MRSHLAARMVALFVLAGSAFAQEAAPLDSSLPKNFYPQNRYQVAPIGNGDRSLLTLWTDGSSNEGLIVETVKPADGTEVRQYVLSRNGTITIFSKTIVEGKTADGQSVLVSGLWMSTAGSPAAPTPVRMVHQSSSEWTSLPRKDKNFAVPARMERVGFPATRIRVWLKWDGSDEIKVEPIETSFKSWPLTLGGITSGLKYLSNVNTDSSYAPRFFYLQRNKNDSITIFGNDDMDKLKAIEKAQEKK